MFEYFTLDLSTAGTKTLPRRPYHALAIAGHSEADLALVDGVQIGPGSPALFDGSDRSPSIQRVRRVGSLTLLAVLDPCGLSAIPSMRTMLHQLHALKWEGVTGEGTFTVNVPGRRHTSIGVNLGDPIAGTLTVVGTRRGNLFAPTTKTLIDAHVIPGASGIYSVEIGGADHEESWDKFDITITSGVTEVSGGILVVESYGELGR